LITYQNILVTNVLVKCYSLRASTIKGYSHRSLISTLSLSNMRGRHGRDHMVVGFTTICAIGTYHYWSCEFEPHSWRGVLDTTLCDKVCKWLARGLWFSPGTLVFFTNKTDHHNIAEILLKVALNTITLTHPNPLKIGRQEWHSTLSSLILSMIYKQFNITVM